MGKYLLKFNFLMLLFFSQLSLAQDNNGTVSGIVEDNAGPLPGVNVLVKGTSTGVTTDFDGRYVLEDIPEGSTLVFSYLSYKTQEIPVNSRTEINVTMESDTQSLEDVVVVGYGTQNRSEVTGAISSIDSEEIASVPVATADQALQGRAPGVNVVNSGAPGNSPVVSIRGLGTPNNNSPLYVIDGIIASGMGDLNPNDIENIQVLKDAATTAVYGSKGSNGVVLITWRGSFPQGACS